MNEILWPLVAVYLLVVVGIGVWSAKRRVTTYEDMTVAGRSVGPWLIACSVAATWINGVTLITITGFGKSFGLSSYWHTSAVGIGTLWIGIFLIPRMWKLRVITTPQILERFFGPTHRLVALFVAMLRDFGATAGTIGATAIVTSSALDISIFTALVLTYFITVLYVALGGMWAVLLTDTIQFFIIVLGTVLLLVLSIVNLGGLGAMVEKVDEPALFSFTGNFDALEILGWFSMGFFLACGYQSLAQRAFSASSAAVARRGFIYGGFLTILWYIIPALLGLVGIAFFRQGRRSRPGLLEPFGSVGGAISGKHHFHRHPERQHVDLEFHHRDHGIERDRGYLPEVHRSPGRRVADAPGVPIEYFADRGSGLRHLLLHTAAAGAVLCRGPAGGGLAVAGIDRRPSLPVDAQENPDGVGCVDGQCGSGHRLSGRHAPGAQGGSQLFHLGVRPGADWRVDINRGPGGRQAAGERQIRLAGFG